jgi:flagellar M-ring protein FliF
MDNFRSSVTADLNTDSQQIQETVYDPESKVERSVRTTKEAQQSQQKQSDNATTVEQNIPQAAPEAGGAGGPESQDKSDKKEEQTNYEINSKTTATTRSSYKVEKLSIAVVVNKGRIAKMVGEPADQAKVDAYLAEMQKIVASAAGTQTARGDVVTVTAMDFLDNQLLEDTGTGVRVMDMLSRNLAGIINSLAFVVGRLPGHLDGCPSDGPQHDRRCSDRWRHLDRERRPRASGLRAGRRWRGGALMDGFGSDFGFDSTEDLLSLGDDDGSFNRRVKEGPERKLSRMVEINEERAAKILRKWAVGNAA